MVEDHGHPDHWDALIRQYSLRQMEQNKQIRQALQQANAALQQAQQLLQEDDKFHQEVHETGDLKRNGLMSGQQQEKECQSPPWLLGRPPDLQ